MSVETVTRVELKLPKAVTWDKGELLLLDQTQLPGKEVLLKQETIEDVFLSIKELKVRGAPAIGIAGAYGLLIGLQRFRGLPLTDFLKTVEVMAKYLISARPTAVNLSWAINRLVRKAKLVGQNNASDMYEMLVREAELIQSEDAECCQAIGRFGNQLIGDGMGILTHCNAGSLAVSELGTALAPIYYAQADKKKVRVFADETRPLLQGSRLTAWELQRQGVDVTLICDNMAASMMAAGEIQMVIVGTDRVAANGDVANKIGTLGVAILAKYYKIPFYVACPSSTIDLNTKTGDQIEIEERHIREVVHFGVIPVAPDNIKARNPAFDVTPNELVTGIITEKGIIGPNYTENLARIFG